VNYFDYQAADIWAGTKGDASLLASAFLGSALVTLAMKKRSKLAIVLRTGFGILVSL
jgi:hypothetical protein